MACREKALHTRPSPLTSSHIQCSSAAANPSRLRLLLFTNSVIMGGLERHVELLARHLDRTQFEVFSLCPAWQPIEQFDHTLRQLSDRHARCTPDRRWGLRRELSAAITLYRLLRSWHIDVMHMHLTTFNGGVLALLTARLAGVRVIVCTEHLAPERRVALPARLLRRGFVRLIDQLVCVSEKNRAAREAHLYTPARRTTVVVNGVDIDDFTPIAPEHTARLRADLGLPPQARIAGSVVRFTAEKGLDYLLAAFPQVVARCPDAYLLLVGDGPLRADLEAQAVALGIRERVVFAGFHADPRPYLALIDAFVLPVPVGSMSIGLLEAMAMRRAVVITFGGEGEAVVHDQSGLCAPPRDAAALAEAMIRLLNNPVEARAFGEAARRRVEEHFSAAGVAARLGTLYATLSAGAPRR